MADRFGELVEGASQGDPVCIETLLAECLPGLRGYLRLRAGKLLLDRESCSDLAQSVCRDLLENLDAFQYGGAAGFRRWLYTTAQRKIADRYEYYRAAKRDARKERIPESSERELLEAYQPFYSPSQQAAAREELDKLEECFARLPEEQQEVILLAKQVGLSRREVAAAMGRTEGSVRMLLSRAMAHLAELLDE